MATPEHFYDARVSVTACDPLTFEDLTPLLTDLNEQFVTVSVRRDNTRPTMAGGWDVVIGLLILGAGAATIEFVRKFAGMLAEDTYKAIRDRLRKLRDKADEEASERVWTLTIQIGSHLFHFHGTMDDEEFKRRLRAAQATLDGSPPDLIEQVRAAHVPPEMEPGWHWREDHWEATPLLREWMERR